ncbi:hypothetical protein BCR34DRAFT_663525 [Clohesyomyces aquaticus]|uniref:Uncharacterized protein n=1 Tax=Clohesyomyces aquaticus TaxID=1231657 RepID=A0A1Y1ZT53_9PLEO|nr:hypothetical protein BCR34DRAFT_663525 [Clohesyomyces aquaticus]
MNASGAREPPRNPLRLSGKYTIRATPSHSLTPRPRCRAHSTLSYTLLLYRRHARGESLDLSCFCAPSASIAPASHPHSLECQVAAVRAAFSTVLHSPRDGMPVSERLLLSLLLLIRRRLLVRYMEEDEVHRTSLPPQLRAPDAIQAPRPTVALSIGRPALKAPTWSGAQNGGRGSSTATGHTSTSSLRPPPIPKIPPIPPRHRSQLPCCFSTRRTVAADRQTRADRALRPAPGR